VRASAASRVNGFSQMNVLSGRDRVEGQGRVGVRRARDRHGIDAGQGQRVVE
jgi:hypothetical protein